MTFFSSLHLEEWQQFHVVEMRFHDRLTVITGANGSGKTTILNLLAQHVDWQVPSLSVPRRSPITGVIEFLTRIFRRDDQSNDFVIGSLTYANKQNARLVVPNSAGANYQISIENRQAVPCFFVPSHRSVYRYQPVSHIPAARLDKQQAFSRVWNSTRNRYFGGGEYPSSFHMKETLISWSVFGRGNPDMTPDPELLALYEGFQETLTKVLPTNLGFRKFSIRGTEVVLECDSGDFMIDGASGGLATIIDLAWQIFMFSAPDPEGFTVLIDEVENHLHPTMQRRVLTDLLTAFPRTRFIVSTHSPLIVNSVRSSFVYVLRYDNDQRVVSEALDFENRAAPANQILSEVLGVPTTIPIWAENELRTIVSDLASKELTDASFRDLRASLQSIGLEYYVPEALGRILEAREK